MILNLPSPIANPANLSCTSTFPRGKLLPLKPELLWNIERGIVRTTTWDEEGDETTLGLWGAGDKVGRPLSKLLIYQVECLTPVDARCVVWDDRSLQDTMLSHIQQMETLMKINYCKTVASRLMELLKWLSIRFGRRVEEGWVLDLHLTHRILADIIRTSRVTVTRQLNEFEQKGKIMRLGQGTVIVLF
jgi:CRP-like cAMP-binding protein